MRSLFTAALLFVEILLMGWVETKRWQDFRNPGSQGDGSFFGITDGLKGKANGYPGAAPSAILLLCGIACVSDLWQGHIQSLAQQCLRTGQLACDMVALNIGLLSNAGGIFDPLGLSKGSDEQLRKYQENEVKNGRLAMVRYWHPAPITCIICTKAPCALPAAIDRAMFWSLILILLSSALRSLSSVIVVLQVALLGFGFQAAAYPGTGPVDNLLTHIQASSRNLLHGCSDVVAAYQLLVVRCASRLPLPH